MSTAVITDTRADVQAAHLEAAALVADLDLDDRRQWLRVDRAIAELAEAAYDLAAAISHTPPRNVAAHVPPVVRISELASAQRQLFTVLDQHPDPDPELLAWAGKQARELVERLRHNAHPTW
ncbi:MAG TPA: hypothetical protein VIL37_10870 [Natronosporangium sp.]